MNPLTNVRNLAKLNERELNMGIAGDAKKSWHQKYRDSAWIFIGGLNYAMTEGDVISVFSQYGEVVNVNLVRDRKTGKSRGFCFLCYEDQRSTVLSVDNLNGTKLASRIIRVDHVEEYRVPKEHGDEDEEVRKLWMEGCAPKAVRVDPEPSSDDDVKKETDDFNLLPLDPSDLQTVKRNAVEETAEDKARKKEEKKKRKKKKKKEKRTKKEKKEKSKKRRRTAEDEKGARRRRSRSESSSSSSSSSAAEDQRDWRSAQLKTFKEKVEQRPQKKDFGNWGEEYVSEYKPPPPKKEFKDWREKEIWKLERERERMITGEEIPKKKEDESYLPSRYRR